MKTIILKRVINTLDLSIIGILMTDNYIPFALTLELPWVKNQINISCVPPGTYHCNKIVSPKFGNTFEVENVPGRSNILFHGGDNTKATQGCILTGLSFGGTLDNVLDGCREALDRLFTVASYNEFTLKIND